VRSGWFVVVELLSITPEPEPDDDPNPAMAETNPGVGSTTVVPP